jgi:hypothetical protein
VGMVGTELTTLVSYGTGIQRNSVPCPHTIHPARGGGFTLAEDGFHLCYHSKKVGH